MKTIAKKDNSIFPQITDLKSAQSVGRQGSIACLLLILFSIILPLIYPETSTISRDTIVGSAMFGVLMILIYRMSRVGAVITLVLYTISVTMAIRDGSLPVMSWVVVGLYFLCFINGVRGTFAYHQIRKQRQMEIDRPEEVSVSE